MSVNIASIEIDLTASGTYLIEFLSKAASSSKRLLLKEIEGDTSAVAYYLKYFFEQFCEYFEVPLFEKALEKFIEQQAEMK